MKCDEVKDQLILLAYDEIPETDHAELELHLRNCSECQVEADAMLSLTAMMAENHPMPEVSPNLLAASRLRLDEALDEASESTWGMRLRNTLVGAWQHLYAAPALATLLVGAGFLSGNLLTRYQLATTPLPQPAVVGMNDAEGVVSNVSGVLPLPDADRVEVRYNRVVPMTIQGRLDDPQVRQLLTMAAQKGLNNDVRETSVDLLAKECVAGHRCEHGEGDRTGIRDALLVSLRYDKSPAVRVRALEGLQRFIGEDQRVRDAVLESLMHDSNADVRTRAISMLEPVEGDTSVRQVLHTVSTQDDNPYIRNASMQVLGNIDGIQ
ncbi:MAG TPA: HEAT repeat domain-containing protein [Terriglobus sp.]